jgi:hypothetical protein
VGVVHRQRLGGLYKNIPQRVVPELFAHEDDVFCVGKRLAFTELVVHLVKGPA